MQIERWRREFPDCERVIHLNHSGVSPISRRVAQAVGESLDLAMHAEAAPPTREARVEAARDSCARLIGAAPHEVAFITNTSHGLSLIASSQVWKPGDNVVAVDGDYPANIYPWWGQRRFGVAVRLVSPRGWRVGVDDVRAAIDERTRVVAVSAVDWQSGFRCNLSALGALCRERDILFCVDGIQAVGAVRVDVERDLVDCLAVGGHKWLMAPQGCGLLFVSQRIVERLQPVVLGWKSVVDAEQYLPYHFQLQPDARRFESGTLPYLGISAIGAAVDLLHEVGPAAIEARVLDLTAQFAEGLRARGAEIVSPWGEHERSGILTFRLGAEPEKLVEALQAHAIICRPRAGGIRLAPHFYLSRDDIARFFAVVDQLRRA